MSNELADILTTDVSPDEALRNIAQAVIELTEVRRAHNGRGRSRTYAGTVDDIASAARQLAEEVLKRTNGGSTL